MHWPVVLFLHLSQLLPFRPLSMGSQTFSVPPTLDNDSVIITDIWDHHEKHSSNHPLFRFASGEAGAISGIITWGEGIHAMHAAGRIILDALDKDGVFIPGAHDGERPVIAILAVSGQLQIASAIAF